MTIKCASPDPSKIPRLSPVQQYAVHEPYNLVSKTSHASKRT